MDLLLKVLAFLVGLVGMEGVAWATHKYVMHGPLWFLHRDHHQPHEGVLERNDGFALFFATPAILLMVLGGGPSGPWFWLGLGISAYGLAYFLMHDVLVHRRLKHRIPVKHPYLKRLVRAHKVHHRQLERKDAEAFGFLWAPRRYHVKSTASKKA